MLDIYKLAIVLISMCQLKFILAVGLSMLKIMNYNDVIMSAMASQFTGVSIFCSTVCPGADEKTQRSAPLAFVRVIHQLPVDSHHKMPVTRKMFPLDNVIICYKYTDHKKFMNTSSSAKSVVIIKFEGRYLENKTS